MLGAHDKETDTQGNEADVYSASVDLVTRMSQLKREPAVRWEVKKNGGVPCIAMSLRTVAKANRSFSKPVQSTWPQTIFCG